MKTIIAIIFILSFLTAAALGQPTITQISNAASASLSVPGPVLGAWLTLPNGNISQGSYFTIYGNGFGGNTSVWNPYPLPTELNGTTVSITVGQSAPIPAYIEFAAQLSGYSQVNAILPSGTPLGAGTLTVTFNGQTSAPAPISVVASSFGTFSQNQAGDGPGIITDASFAKFTPYHTATPGQTVILWGTGLSPATDITTEATTYPAQVNQCTTAAACPVTVWVGGQQATVAYAGSAGYTGEDEIVFAVPSTVTNGCNVSVALQTGTPGGTLITSNFTSLPVDPSGTTCSDADGVSMSDLASAVQSKGSANVASIGLLSQYWNVNLGDGIFIQWDNDTVDGRVGTFGNAALDLFRGFTRVPSVNSCTAAPFRGYPPPTDYGLGYVTYLDAGPALSIQGPLATEPVAKNSTGAYVGLVGGDVTAGILDATGSAEAPFYLDATANGDGSFDATGIATGDYTVTGPGGAAVGAFTGTLDLSSTAASFSWTNASTFDNQNARPIIPRNAPLNITWTGGDPQAFVDITLIGSLAQYTEPSTADPEPGMYVECVVQASLGSFNVPAYVLQALPQTTVDGTPSGSDLPGVVLVGQTSPVTKVSPAPTGLDAAYLYYRIISGYTVDWQ